MKYKQAVICSGAIHDCDSGLVPPQRGRTHRSYSKLGEKRAVPVWDYCVWRFDNRKNPLLFRDTMLRLIHSENLEYEELTAKAA
jgi:hypothetical protein